MKNNISFDIIKEVNRLKKILLIISFLFILTGCTDISGSSYDSIIDKVLNENTHKQNTYMEGYKLYLPSHMTIIGDLKGNEILYSYGDKYYLYVDLISYYNKKQNKYNIATSDYKYSKQLNYNDLIGYVTVSDSKGGYLVEVMYNYAKIEVVTDNVNRAIASSLLVLKSIDYNYKIVDSMIGSNALVYDSELFELLGPKKKENNFLEYVEEYGQYKESETNKDEDVITMESSD